MSSFDKCRKLDISLKKFRINPSGNLLKGTVKFSNMLIPVINLINLSLGARLWYAFKKEDKLNSNDKNIITATFVISLLFTVYLFYVIYVQLNDGYATKEIYPDCDSNEVLLKVSYKKKRMILFYLMVSVFQLMTSYRMFVNASSEEKFSSGDKNNAMFFTLLSVFSFILSAGSLGYNIYTKRKSKGSFK